MRGILAQTADKIVDPHPEPQLGNRIPKVPATNFIDVSASFWARSAIEPASRGVFVGVSGVEVRPESEFD